jgi:selenocysteine lyase/cysteine desulfurase
VPLTALSNRPPDVPDAVLAGPLVDAACDLLGARPEDVVVVRGGLSDVVSLLARRIPAGPESLVALPCTAWSNTAERTVGLAATLAGTVVRVVDELAVRRADLLAVPGAHPLTGDVLPLAELADVAHAHGARIAVDAGPLVATGGLDLAACDVDYAVFSGLDVHAPVDAGVLVGRGDWLEPRPPLPRRSVSAALAAACRDVAALSPGALAAHEAELRSAVLLLLRELPGVRAVPGWPDARRHSGLVAFTVDGFAAADVARIITVQHGLPGVTSVCDPHLVPVGGAVRIRLDVAWAGEDIDRLREALEDVLTTA